jgi:CobQ/CobB/MinD/ParA nucleotide binding domain
MTKPAVVLIGGDKGGVGKTTVARTLLDYFAHQQLRVRAFDTEVPRGTLKRFHPNVTDVVDINHVPDQMRIFDTVNSTDATVTLIDVRAGLLSPTLHALRRRARRAFGTPSNLAQQANDRAAQSVSIWLCIAGRCEHYRFRISDANALRTSDCEIPNCRAILDGVTPALKAARTAFNFPCVKGTAATASTPSLRETAASCFPRRFCSAMTADSNWSSSWSLSCLTAFGKSAGRTWREGIALGGTGDSEDREGASPMGADENRSGDDERARVPIC